VPTRRSAQSNRVYEEDGRGFSRSAVTGPQIVAGLDNRCTGDHFVVVTSSSY
jgi:hypothetical protein